MCKSTTNDSGFLKNSEREKISNAFSWSYSHLPYSISLFFWLCITFSSNCSGLFLSYCIGVNVPWCFSYHYPLHTHTHTQTLLSPTARAQPPWWELLTYSMFACCSPPQSVCVYHPYPQPPPLCAAPFVPLLMIKPAAHVQTKTVQVNRPHSQTYSRENSGRRQLVGVITENMWHDKKVPTKMLTRSWGGGGAGWYHFGCFPLQILAVK